MSLGIPEATLPLLSVDVVQAGNGGRTGGGMRAGTRESLGSYLVGTTSDLTSVILESFILFDVSDACCLGNREILGLPNV